MPPVFVSGLLTKLVREVDRAPRVVVDERRGPAIDQSIPDLQLVTALQPDQHVLDLVVELAGIDGQERRAAREPVKFVMSMFGSPS